LVEVTHDEPAAVPRRRDRSACFPPGHFARRRRGGVEAAFAFAQQKRATSIHDGYEADFRLFEAWCGENGLAFPAGGAVHRCDYIAIEAQRGIRPSTLERRLAAIRYTHIEAGHESPADNRHVRDVMAGIRNEKGTAPDRKAPATADRLTAMLSCPGRYPDRQA
jgi:hypothetical protein